MRASDYHTHTVYSHGKGRIEDNVRAAIQRGLKVSGLQTTVPAIFIGVKGKRLFAGCRQKSGNCRKIPAN